MREQMDRWVGIGAIAAVVVVPTVLVMTPWKQQAPAETNSGPAQRVPVGDTGAPVTLPSPATSRPLPSLSAPPRLPLPELSPPAASRSARKPVRVRPAGAYLPADTGARVVEVKWTGKRQADIAILSPSLAAIQKVRVLVPPAWKTGATRSWPTLYAYHGGNDTYVSWTRSTDIESLAARYDVLVAMPEGANGSYTDWYNNGAGGPPKWETFHTVEVRQILERNFGAGSQRAAMGISSGGQGAITYAARHPGMFEYSASFSGVLSMLAPGMPSILLFLNSGNGADSSKIWGDPTRHRANWKAHDPASLASNLRGTRVFVSAGNGSEGPYDPKGLAFWDIRYLSEQQVLRATRDFAGKARRAGVPITSNFYGAGSHSWPYWQREMHRIWPAMMSAIQADRL